MSDLGSNVAKKVNFATLTTFFAKFDSKSDIYYLEKINYNSEEKKKLQKVGFEPETFRTADAHAANRLQGALAKPASIALFKPAPYITAIV